MDSATKTPITLAGRKFNLACLPFKKNRVVVNAAWNALIALNKSNPEKGVEPIPMRTTDIDYMYLAVYEALSYADPTLTREDFDSWGLYFPEMIKALRTVAFQTGVLVELQVGAKGEAAGEPTARS